VTTNRDILVELLKTRNVPDDQARIAADLFCELVNDERCGWGQDRPANPGFRYFGREVTGRVLVMMLDMLSDRLTQKERDRLREKIVKTLS
jgi:hypothetical protein